MMKKILFVLPMIACLCSGVARANWEYDGENVRDGYYQDDGRRFIIAVRGGLAYGMAKMKNDVGTLTATYYQPEGGGVPFICDPAYEECDAYEYIGIGDIGTLPAKKPYSEVSFTAGMAIGWTLPVTPHWRFQVDWDYISETETGANPLFDGDLKLTGGDNPDVKSIKWQSGSAQIKTVTNVVSAMAIRDFYSGWQKPLRRLVPYAGVGLGYADTDTILNLSDSYGDLSGYYVLRQYAEIEEGLLHFYSSKKSSSNLAGILTLGLSYGVSESFFLDFGFRFIAIPQIKYALSNADGSRSRDWFHAENMIYSNFLFGFRWEF